MTACTWDGIDLHKASNCFGGIFLPAERKNFCQLRLHLLGASGVVDLR